MDAQVFWDVIGNYNRQTWIVPLYNVGGTLYPQLEREYSVNRSTISGWVKQFSRIKVSDNETVTLENSKSVH